MKTPNTLDVVRAIFHDPPTNDVANHDTGEARVEPSSQIAPDLGDAVLMVEDIAALLRVGRNTIYGLVARNQIPHRRLGKTIRFSRSAVMSWLSTSWQVAREGK